MFTHFTYAAKDFTARHNIKSNLLAASVCGEAEKAIHRLLRKKITTIAYRGKTLFIKTNSFPLANEIKLKERQIKDELKQCGFVVEVIRCAA
ncbi:hypothetical protein A3C91_03655 [Candidatus Azambacteria bacterium RIFCSPHIGHO2_02_FULL_52_12]|uniref:Uncharacterized protein n=1 Tax=Candidatus Azambacteria bacterium RIFCSPLOWO2_01_FULL_46_25 TaxID=1797298 RepID=A0A1F5BUT3_9BACT|nr:MAG: hypothetical protein A3C91_03655 [Candidatus Azambacteria bacterium RIFCSPHIGHO2_02_FULL_52_12]OGD34374.1 MAG: hypothetical protein A2988_02495 [Candidatus Azambacteria bacterium RIFCSPLOWO2_01_FULL_46_25]OGD37348.1 MAG: hypothetical protein A2850_01390 [Candidatus Azambacteria bacterium RIFCSPHIGHO2_01_FULL_51_74]